eukprot:TRINITY_DN985_c0_g1_i1.p1 TRINITY_DN985_c0_g1~~TRINITY_DN985_c0_g1_i1.p1  ORF type:complete len:807 (-),score=275.46 TRINITY_DN985_c0_g1_i1:96-2495(-)
MAEVDLSLIAAIGFEGKKLAAYEKNVKARKALLAVLEESNITKAEPDVGILLSEVATKFPESQVTHRPFLVKYVLDGRLNNRAKNSAAIAYFKSLKGDLDVAAFEKKCGVGIVTDDESVKKAITELVESHDAMLKEKNWDGFRDLMSAVKSDPILQWAAGKFVNTCLEEALIAKIGARPAKVKKAPVQKKAAAAKVAVVNEDELDPSQYHELRLRSLADLKKQGVEPYPHKFQTSSSIAEFRTKYEYLKTKEQLDVTPENTVSLAGRITYKRANSSKLLFYTLAGPNAEVQILANFKFYEDAKMFKIINEFLRRGDVIGVVGVASRSNTGELSIVPTEIKLLSPCLHMMPHPESLTDTETRYRQRHLDLLVNGDAIRTFKIRARALAYMRTFFNARGFTEVETPTMNLLAGGATAKPFVTYHNDLSVNLFMRVAPELFLKQCIVGGMDRVYEIGKNYRNEGIDMTHNPEFTAIEFYEAFADYKDVMATTEELLSGLVKEITGGYIINYYHNGKEHGLTREELIKQLKEKLPEVTFPEDLTNHAGQKFLQELLAEKKVVCHPPVTASRMLDALALEYIVEKLEINFEGPYPRIPMVETLEKKLNVKFPEDVGSDEANKFLIDLCAKHEIDCSPPRTNARLLDKLVGEYIEPELISPAFITDHPQIMSPLAKWHRSKPFMTERFEMFVAGREICNAYTELNDPAVQRERFETQVADAAAGDDEAQPIDEGFVKSMEYGLPPTGGWGLGVDRLVMLLANHNTIKEVLLFPAMKPLDEEREAQNQQLKFATGNVPKAPPAGSK